MFMSTLFCLIKKTKSTRNLVFLFKGNLKLERQGKFYRDFAGFDMSYDEINETC